MLDKSILEGKVISELQTIAESLGVQGHQRMRKGDLIQAIVDRASQDGDGHEPGSPSDEAGGGVATEVDTADRAESPNGEAAVADARTDAPADASGDGSGDGDGARGTASASTDTGTRERETREPREGEPRESRGPSQDGDTRPRNRRPTREERRRQREERHQREMEQREQELAEAPVRTGILDVLPEGYGFL